jgi:hypothetical protein
MVKGRKGDQFERGRKILRGFIPLRSPFLGNDIFPLTACILREYIFYPEIL